MADIKTVTMKIAENRKQLSGKNQTGRVEFCVLGDGTVTDPNIKEIATAIDGVCEGVRDSKIRVGLKIPTAATATPPVAALRGERWMVNTTSGTTKKRKPLIEIGTANSTMAAPGTDLFDLTSANGVDLKKVIEDYCVDAYGETVTVNYVQLVNRNER